MTSRPIQPLIIRVIQGLSAGFELRVADRVQISIGREGVSDLVLHDRGVSRKHGKFTFQQGSWQFEDLGSTNGVVVTRQAGLAPTKIGTTPIIVISGDEFIIGEARLSVEAIALEDDTELLDPQSSQQTLRLQTGDLDSCGAGGDEHLPKQAEIDFFSRGTEFRLPHNRSLPFAFRSYQVLKKIGEGGMGEVYLAARDSSMPTPNLAIKFLRSQKSLSADDRARFLREMQISVQLKHPSIIGCVDCGEEDGQPFIVMPYCSGGNLAELLKRSGPLTVRRSLRLLDRLLAGVEHAHKAGIVHRDLKPFNVLLAKDERGKYSPKISDFGLAKSYLLAGESGMTVNGTVGGSWGYMPREQLTNFRFVSPHSDVWSLGAIVYECLTGQLPRPLQPGVEPIRVVLESKIVPLQELLPTLPAKIAEFVMTALAPDTSDRFPDAGAMRSALMTTARAEQIEL